MKLKILDCKLKLLDIIIDFLVIYDILYIIYIYKNHIIKQVCIKTYTYV